MNIWFPFDKKDNIATILNFAPKFGADGIHWVSVNSDQILWGRFQKKIEWLFSWTWKKFCFCFFPDSSLKRVPLGRIRRHVDGLMNCFSQNIHLGFVINLRPFPSKFKEVKTWRSVTLLPCVFLVPINIYSFVKVKLGRTNGFKCVVNFSKCRR